MAETFITYQCTVCRKTKDSVRDTLRAVPNVCSITPGCNGRLLIVAEKSQLDAYSPISKLASGPNDRLLNTAPVERDQTTLLSTSNFGSLSIAVKFLTGLSAADDRLKVKVLQRKLNDVQYQQYVFKTTASTNKIPETSSSKDIAGKFLRFDSVAISQNRISVLVNGVLKTVGSGANEISLAPNTVNFNTAIAQNSTVSVIVYSEQVTTENELIFERNQVAQNTDVRFGSWSNVKRVEFTDDRGKLPAGSTTGGWYTYSCTLLSNLSYNTKIKIESIANANNQVIKTGGQLSDVRFLLAANPYRHADRYYNFVVGADALNSDYLMTSSSSGFLQLSVNTDIVTEIYPPLEILSSRSDFISPDDYTNSSGTDTTSTTLTSKLIIGPI